MKFFYLRCLLIFSFQTINVFAYDCKVVDNALIVQDGKAVEILVINKIETISAISTRGELNITFMSGNKRNFICQNNQKIVEEIMKQLFN